MLNEDQVFVGKKMMHYYIKQANETENPDVIYTNY